MGGARWAYLCNGILLAYSNDLIDPEYTFSWLLLSCCCDCYISLICIPIIFCSFSMKFSPDFAERKSLKTRFLGRHYLIIDEENTVPMEETVSN